MEDSHFCSLAFSRVKEMQFCCCERRKDDQYSSVLTKRTHFTKIRPSKKIGKFNSSNDKRRRKKIPPSLMGKTHLLGMFSWMNYFFRYHLSIKITYYTKYVNLFVFQLHYTGRRVNVREYPRVLNWNTRKRFGALNPKQSVPPLFDVFVPSSIPPLPTRLCRYMSAMFISFDMEAVAQRKRKIL